MYQDGDLLDGRYLVKGILRRTPTWEALQALDQRTNRLVAVIIPLPGGSAGEEARLELRRQLQQLAQVEHPRLVTAYDLGSHDGVPHVVVHLPEGGDLAALMARAGRVLTPEQVASWAAPVAQALDHIHAMGRVHDDLCVHAVQFDARGKAFLGDFRVATAMRAIAQGSELPLAGEARDLAAPERLRGGAPTPRSDQHALAALMASTLVGRALEPGEEPGEAIPSLPRAAAAALATGIALKPGDRHGSCVALVEGFVRGCAPAPPERVAAAPPRRDEPRAEEPRRSPEPAEEPAPRPARSAASAETRPPEKDEDDSIVLDLRGRRPVTPRAGEAKVRRGRRSGVVTILLSVGAVLLVAALAAATWAWLNRDLLAAVQELRAQGLALKGPSAALEVRLGRAGGADMQLVRAPFAAGERWVAVDVQDLAASSLEDAEAACRGAGVRVATIDERAVAPGGDASRESWRCALAPGERVEELPAPAKAPVRAPELGVASVLPARGATVIPGLLVLRGDLDGPAVSLVANGIPCELDGRRFACEVQVGEGASEVALAGRGADGADLHETLTLSIAPPAAEAETWQAAGLAVAGQEADGTPLLRRPADGALMLVLAGGSVAVDRWPVRVPDWSAHGGRGGAAAPFAAGDPDAPITSISGVDAEGWCAAVGARLPTDAEWSAATKGAGNGSGALLSASGAGALGAWGRLREWVTGGDGKPELAGTGLPGAPAPNPREPVADATFRCARDLVPGTTAPPPPPAPPATDALLAQAESLVQQGRVSRGEPNAVAVLRQVLALEPGNAQAARRLQSIGEDALSRADTASKASQWGDAARWFGVALAVDPRSSQAKAGRDAALASQKAELLKGDVQKRMEAKLRAALETPLEPDPGARHAKLAEIRGELGDEVLEDAALERVRQQVLTATGDVIRALLERSAAAEKKGRLEDALAPAREAAKLEPEDRPSTEAVERLQSAIHKRDRSLQLVADGDAARREGRSDEAAKAYAAALQVDGSPRAQQGLDELQAELVAAAGEAEKAGKWSEAVAKWTRAAAVQDREAVQSRLAAAKAEVADSTRPPAPCSAGTSRSKFPVTCRPRDGARMLLVKASDVAVGGAEKRERKKVSVDFLVDEREVSWEQYRKYASALGRSLPSGTPAAIDEPVMGVAWEEAERYCRWVGARLPRDEEWEVAAAGPTRTKFPWGDEWIDTPPHAAWGAGVPRPTTKPFMEGASPFGVLHMAGNVAEWVATGSWPLAAGFHWARGGSYRSASRDDLETSHARVVQGDQGIGDIGFRCARDP